MGGFWDGVVLAALTLCFSPVISFLLNKFLSYLYDTSQKLIEMRSRTIPRLKFTLEEVVEQRMLIELSEKESDVSKVTKLSDLETLQKNLKDALYEAEDILDLIDYHRIEKEVGRGESSTWLQWYWQCLYDSTRERSGQLLQWAKQTLCWLRGYLHIAGERSAPLLQWVKQGLCLVWLWVGIARGKLAPLLQLGRQGLCWFRRRVARPGEIPVTSTPSPSLLQRLSSWCRSLDFKNYCLYTFNLLTMVYMGAGHYRDMLVFKSNQQGMEMESDCIIMGPLFVCQKKNMKKIEKLIDEAQQTISFKKKVHEIIEQGNEPRSNESGTCKAKVSTENSHKTSADPIGKVTGRDEVRDKIRIMLGDEKADVVGIYGIPGSGKTTLAQYVCTSEKGDKHFDLVIWIHVTQNFSELAIFSEMFEAATNKKAEYTSLDVLQTNLKNELTGKKILLVLDDIWCNKDACEQNLQPLLFALKVGLTGSKVLATSRNIDAFAALGPEVRCAYVPIPDLDDEVFCEMFMHHALGSSVLLDPERRKLEEIGAEIAKKLKRSPLAARTVGGQLRRRQNDTFWRSLRDSDLSNETMGALLWVYQHLDEQVRQCFAFCSIFPRRHHLEREELVWLWVAEGLIKTVNAGEELDAIGQRYFDELLSVSFLQPGGEEEVSRHETAYFTIHDLLRDLAEQAAGGDCFRIEKGSTGEVSPDVRHLFVQSCDQKVLTDKIFELQNLRTLIFEGGALKVDDCIKNEGVWGERKEDVFGSIFRRLRKLRVLILPMTGGGYACGTTFSLSASIDELKHLRYFAFPLPGMTNLILPASITMLYHVQLLNFGTCSSLVFSSGEDMNKLLNLRRVISHADLKFPNIGKLTWLQILPIFTVRKEHGYELRQLKLLNKLEGKLQIDGLGNVQSKDEAIEASIADKERLTELVLVWGNPSCSPEIESEVLQALCPSKYLDGRLEIMYYSGLAYPNWMMDKQKCGPKHLQELVLKGCTGLGPAPELFEVFVHLRLLWLESCNWEVLPNSVEQLTSLKKLALWYCSRIQSLPTLPQSLENFELRRCNEVFMRSCQTIEDPNWEKIRHIPQKEFFSY